RIFDGIVTGFRLALGGAQEHFGVVPDLACFGKGMSNGFPLSALVGRRDIMRLLEEVFFSFTAGGEVASLVACLATLSKLERCAVIPQLWRQGERIRKHVDRAVAAAGVAGVIQGVGRAPRPIIAFSQGGGGPWWGLKRLF